METRTIKHRLRRDASEIRTIEEEAPWVKVVIAARDSRVGEKQIRETFSLRRFGNADFVSPKSLNHWILTGEVK